MASKASVTLSLYEIRLRKPRQRVDYYKLNDFDRGHDFLNFLQSVIANWAYVPSGSKVIVNDEEKQKIVRLVPNTLKLFGRQITSLVETGDYGTISNIIDSVTGEVKYKKRAQDADVLPFFIMFYIPQDMTSAIMISQRFKEFGATSIVIDTIKKEFKEKHPTVQMEFSALKSTTLSDKYLSSGKLKKISFKCFDSKVLNSSLNNIEGLNTNDYTLEYNIIPKRGKSIPSPIINMFRLNRDNSKSISQLIKIPYYDYDDVSFDLNLNGHNRTLKASDIESLGSFFDITNDIITGADGLPTYESIKKVAESILDDIKNS